MAAGEREVDLGDDSPRGCPVCFEPLVGRVDALQPCGHLFCLECSSRLRAMESGQCPSCRGPIQEYANVFLPPPGEPPSGEPPSDDGLSDDGLRELWHRLRDAGDDATLPARAQELWILTLAPDVFSRTGRRRCEVRCPHARNPRHLFDVAAGAGALPFAEWETTVEMLHNSIVSGLHATERWTTWEYIHSHLRRVWEARRDLLERLRPFGEADENP